MIATCAGFRLPNQTVSVSGEDEYLIFTALRPGLRRHMKSVQFMTEFDSIIILALDYKEFLPF